MSIEADIADRAADLLETKGWVQYQAERRGKRCLVSGVGQAAWQVCKEAGVRDRAYMCGAVHQAVFDYLGLTSSFRRSINLIDGTVDPGVRDTWCSVDLVDWNDRPERTVYEVIDALRHAAKNLRNASD